MSSDPNPATPLIATAPRAAPGRRAPSNFVLVHGAQVGAWSWKFVSRLLRAEGHEVVATTATGLGDRTHLFGRDITLDTLARDIANTIWYEDLRDVVLVAHSWGGIVATAACEYISERVGEIVYVDAVVPRGGESMYYLMGEQAQHLMDANRDDRGQGWLIPRSPDATRLGIDDPELRAWVHERLSDQPAAGHYEGLRVAADAAARSLPQTYIRCTGTTPIGDPVVSRMRSDPDVKFLEIDAPHLAPITHPALLADLLLTRR